MTTSHPRSLRRRVAAILAAVAASASLLAGGAHAVGTSNQVDDYSGYEPQQDCRGPQAGTVAFAAYLQSRYPATGSLGMARSCGASGTSEHKDGRAFDWAADVANERTKQAAYHFIGQLLATDKRGNAHALARRMGVMYFIYDDTIWSAYRGFEPRPYVHAACRGMADLSRCGRTLRHHDHVHFSLSRSAGAAQTSWYRARDVAYAPVFFPGTRELDPDRTAVADFEVPADGESHGSPFQLRAGVAYRVVATGLVRYGPAGQIGDPNCLYDDQAAGFTPAPRTGLPTDPTPDAPDQPDAAPAAETAPDGRPVDTPAANPDPAARALVVSGKLRWDYPDRCRPNHTYTATFTPQTTRPLYARVVDPDVRHNTGSFTVWVARDDIKARSLRDRFPKASHQAPRPWRTDQPDARALVKETLTLDTSRPWGTMTVGDLRPRHRYKVVVRGVARDAGTRFDASCYRWGNRMRARHTLDVTDPGADHMSLYLSGMPLALRPRGKGTTAADCVTRSEDAPAYVAKFSPPVRGTSRLRLHDPFDYADNDGKFMVTIRRLARR